MKIGQHLPKLWSIKYWSFFVRDGVNAPACRNDDDDDDDRREYDHWDDDGNHQDERLIISR